ncbi:MAG TPA: response regulator [Cellvibrionaceae bacterium]|nr:response regulator [Cellvibrionaceae bacterium]
MHEGRPTVLFVDDSPEDLRLLAGVLVGEFNVLTAESGQQAIALCEEHPIAVAVLDVDMPGMDGYATCRALRARRPTLQILFLSSHDGLDEILRGYDAGGIDYILKPFSAEILRGKIGGALALASNFTKLELEKNEASGAFMAAVASMGDLGVVIHFLRESFQVSVSGDLARLLFECMESYQLQSCVQLRCQFGCENYSSTGPISQLEIELLSRVAQTETRFLARGRRIFINFPCVTLLIKNAPQDESKLGRLKDALAIMLEGLNEKQLSIEKSQQILGMLRSNSRSSLLLLQELEQIVLDIEERFGELRHNNINLIDQLAERLREEFFHLAISDQDERKVMSWVEAAKQEANSLFIDAQTLGAHLNWIKEKIHSKRQ